MRASRLTASAKEKFKYAFVLNANFMCGSFIPAGSYRIEPRITRITRMQKGSLMLLIRAIRAIRG